MTLNNLAIHKPARTVSRLFASDFYEIKNWSLDFTDRSAFKKEYNDCFCLVFVRNGDLQKASYHLYSGHTVIERPNFEYQLLPSSGECTIINFTDGFYSQLNVGKMFRRSTSVVVKTSPEAEYTLFALLDSMGNGVMETDNLVVDFLNQTFLETPFTDTGPELSKNHRSAVEVAKAFLYNNFTSDVSLSDLSLHCGISPFYLSRIFKSATSRSPHQYLLSVRLKHGEMLLRNTSKSVSDITYSSGFTSPEHFSTLFRRKYGLTPTGYRKS